MQSSTIVVSFHSSKYSRLRLDRQHTADLSLAVGKKISEHKFELCICKPLSFRLWGKARLAVSLNNCSMDCKGCFYKRTDNNFNDFRGSRNLAEDMQSNGYRLETCYLLPTDIFDNKDNYSLFDNEDFAKTISQFAYLGIASTLEDGFDTRFFDIVYGLNDDEARQYVRAAADTTDNSGLIPTRQLTEVINPLSNADRPFIDSISSAALPDAGMTFEIPKLTQVPSVALTAEGAAPSEQDQNISFLSVNVGKYAGSQKFSVELLDRSSPAFFAELVRQMEFAYAKATDTAVGSAIITNGTDGGNRTLTAANIQDFISDAAVSIYSGTLGFAENVVVSPEQWGALMGLVDGSNRAVFVQTINPQNASGNLTPTNVRGNIGGLNLRVSRALSGTGDNSIIVLNPTSYTWYESSKYRLETNLISTGQIEVSYYGYGAIATKVAWDTHYSVDLEDLEEFADFLESCGGFEIC